MEGQDCAIKLLTPRIIVLSLPIVLSRSTTVNSFRYIFFLKRTKKITSQCSELKNKSPPQENQKGLEWIEGNFIRDFIPPNYGVLPPIPLNPIHTEQALNELAVCRNHFTSIGWLLVLKARLVQSPFARSVAFGVATAPGHHLRRLVVDKSQKKLEKL